jgi:Transposase
MRIIGCDLHARQQTLAMFDTETGEVVNRTLMHEGNQVREFYSELLRPVLVGIEAIGPMQWFLDLLAQLGIECQVGDATKIRAAEPRKQKHGRRDAELILKLLVEKRFPAIGIPSKELLALRALLLHRHQWVRLRTAGAECATGHRAREWIAAFAFFSFLKWIQIGAAERRSRRSKESLLSFNFLCPATKLAPEKCSSVYSLSYTQTYLHEKPNPTSSRSWSPSPVPSVRARG